MYLSYIYSEVLLQNYCINMRASEMHCVGMCLIYLGIEQHIQNMVWVGLGSPLQSFRQELVLKERMYHHKTLTVDRLKGWF